MQHHNAEECKMRHLFKKLIVWTLCLAMAVGMLPGLARGAKAAAPDAGASAGIAWNDEKVYYEISSYAGLLEFARIVNEEGKTNANAILTKSFSAEESAQATAWTPIGNDSSPYTGKFDGKGCTITGLTIESTGDYIGLFGCVGSGGIVQNVTLEGGSKKGGDYVGGVAGKNEGGTVSNCYNTGKVTGSGNYVGGVAGDNYGIVLGCHNTGKVTGRDSVGGVVGNNYGGEVSNCYNAGDVTGSGLNVGGVVGRNSSGTVSNCYNTGKVTGSEFVGGVVGNNKGKVSNCYNTRGVTGNGSTVGGVVGSNEDTVSNCCNTGAVEGSGNFVGGVVGENRGKVSNCYNTGDVKGNDSVGGAAGWNYGTVSNCYYNQSTCQKDAIGDGNSGINVAGLTTAQMTGENAETSMKALLDAKDGEGNPVWIVRENSLDTYYYPHLKGFAYDATGDVKDWPATISSGYTYELDFASFDYNGEIQKPKVTVKKNGNEVGETLYRFTFVDSVKAGEYTIEFENTETHVKGVIPYSIKKRGLEIIAYNQTFTYNGQMQGPGDELYENEEEIKEFFDIDVDRLASTDSLSYIRLKGQGKDANTYEKALVPHVVIVNGAGQDMTSNYDITYVEGDLIIEPASVTLTANSGTTVTYDGTAKTVSGYTCSVEGLTFDGVTAGVSATKAGTYEVTFAGVTLEKTTDTTGNYKVSKTENGTLTINKKPLTITADSDTKEFDGTALTKNSVTTTALAEGDKLESITVTGTQTSVGTTDNIPSAAKIVNAAGEDVTSCYEITYVNGTLTVTKPAAPKLADDQKPAPKQDLKEDGKEQVLVLDPAKLPDGYTIEYSTDGGKTWNAAPTGTRSGEYTIEVKYTADGNHTDFFGDTLKVMIQGVYNNTESDGDWTKGSGKTYTFRIKKAFNDEVCFENFTGVLVDGKQAKAGENYTAVKGSTVITFAADYLETLSVGEHMIRVVFKDGEILLPLKILEAVATPTPAVDATPVTGDTANPFLLVALVLMSMAGAAAVVMRRRKQA